MNTEFETLHTEDVVMENYTNPPLKEKPSISEIVDNLDRMQIAGIKRIWSTVKQYYKKMEVLQEKMIQLNQQAEELYKQSITWEAPVSELLQGYSVKDVIDYLELNKTKKEKEQEVSL